LVRSASPLLLFSALEERCDSIVYEKYDRADDEQTNGHNNSPDGQCGYCIYHIPMALFRTQNSFSCGGRLWCLYRLNVSAANNPDVVCDVFGQRSERLCGLVVLEDDRFAAVAAGPDSGIKRDRPQKRKIFFVS